MFLRSFIDFRNTRIRKSSLFDDIVVDEVDAKILEDHKNKTNQEIKNVKKSSKCDDENKENDFWLFKKYC